MVDALFELTSRANPVHGNLARSDELNLARLCVLLALYEQLYRMGGILNQRTWETPISLVGRDGVDDIVRWSADLHRRRLRRPSRRELRGGARRVRPGLARPRPGPLGAAPVRPRDRRRQPRRGRGHRVNPFDERCKRRVGAR